MSSKFDDFRDEIIRTLDDKFDRLKRPERVTNVSPSRPVLSKFVTKSLTEKIMPRKDSVELGGILDRGECQDGRGSQACYLNKLLGSSHPGLARLMLLPMKVSRRTSKGRG